MHLPCPRKFAKRSAYAMLLIGMLATTACGGSGNNGGGSCL